MSLGRAMLLPNPEEFTPTVAQAIGASRAIPMMSSVSASRNEAAAVPVQYIGTYPVFSGDKNFMIWSNACSH